MESEDRVIRTLKLVNNPQFSDVKFVLDDEEEVHAHRFALQSGSEYFEVMFNSGMQESKTTASTSDPLRINLPGVEMSALISVLEYIYSGEAKSITADNCI